MLTRPLLLSATGLLLSIVTLTASAACNQTTVIRNTSGITLRFAELKSASSPPFFDSQWTGSRVIPPGDTRQIRWVSDTNCTDGVGVPNLWHLKLVRNNGNVHYCTNIGPSGDVRVDTPSSCSPD